MEMTALASTVSRQGAYDDGVARPPCGSRLVPKVDDQALVNQGQVVHVCFPVIVPGEDGRVIPFGRYDLIASHQNGSFSMPTEEVVLVNLDNGARLVLSAHELTAIARDPDVEIV